MQYLPKVFVFLAVLNLANYSKGEETKSIQQKVIQYENSDSNKTAINCVENEIRSVEDNCNIFEACIRGQYKKINCPPSYYFNAQKAICMPFKYDAQFKCNCLMPEYTVFENNKNCETYFVCHKKSAVIEKCPLGQYYNAKLNTCLTDSKGVCLLKPNVRPQYVDELVTDVQVICKKLGLVGIHFRTFANDCNTFFICVKGQLYKQHCPQDHYYDSDKKYCVRDTIKRCSRTEE